MRVAGFTQYSINDGAGLRQVIYFQGCGHKCEGCHNPSTWNPYGGKLYAPSELVEEVLERWDVLHDGITLSGGDPLYQKEELVIFIKLFKKWRPQATIWLYTGFTYEDVKDLEAVKLCDVIVDGKYIKALKNLSLVFRGSANQRIINIKTGKEMKVIK